MLRPSHTAVVERNVWWEGDWSTEPYETGWATEAIAYVRVLERREVTSQVSLRAQISPDGIHWSDEGSTLILPPDADMVHLCLTHFGGWLRLAGTLGEGQGIKLIVYLSLKG